MVLMLISSVILNSDLLKYASSLAVCSFFLAFAMCHAGCECPHPRHLVLLVRVAVSWSLSPQLPHSCSALPSVQTCSTV